MSELKWKARWISYGQNPADDLGVFRFRRKFHLKPSADALPIRVSADQRYQLFVNGQFVGEGPQRGDLQHWFYDSYDLAPYIKNGENEVEAVVWSFGRYAPMAQMTYRLAFVLEGEGLSTPDGWEVAKVEGHDFEMMHNEVGGFYIDIGPGEVVTRPTPDLKWRPPNHVVHVLERGEFAGDSPWFMVPRTIPAMRRDPWEGLPLVVDRETNDRKPFDSLMIHPGEKVLLDFSELVAAYPDFELEGSQGATVRVTYGEGLFDKGGNKNNRNDVRGKGIKGYQDRFVLGPGQTSESNKFSTLWWRTWRYIQIESDQPVRLKSVSALQTGYPYRVESSFEADDPWVEKIWDVGLRTAKLCAGETYFDCPYYEQLQYVGDTRIQTLLHYYLSRDRLLARNAVEQFSWSVMCDGLTQSRYPSRVMQLIPTFSLWWVMMVSDQRLYDIPMPAHTTTADQVLAACLRWIKDGPEHWPFSDWVDTWPMGIAPGGRHSTLVAVLWHLAAHSTGKSAPNLSQWLKEGLVRSPNDPDWKASEHVEALARLLGLDKPWPTQALEQTKAAKCTYYFQYYKHLAMRPDDYMNELEPWKEMIRNGLTTFAEAPEPTRSDCHAWSAHPILGFFQILAGVTSSGPEWAKAKIQPRPGKLAHFMAKIAHPKDELTVTWSGGKFEIDSPVPFEFVWQGKSQNFLAGKHRI